MTTTATPGTGTDTSANTGGIARRPAVATMWWQAGAVAAGVLAAGCVVGLGATAAWLIATAATHPQVFELMVAVTAVRAFGVGRSVLRYVERLAGHDATLRRLTDVRVAAFRALARTAPAGLAGTGAAPALRGGDLAARIVADVDTSADRWLRVVEPYTVAALVGAGSMALVGVVFTPVAAVLGVSLLASAVAAPAVAASVSRRAEAGVAARRGRLADRTAETLRGAAEIAAFDARDAFEARIREADSALAAAERRAALGQGVAAAAVVLASGGAVVAALGLGAAGVPAGRLTAVALAVVVLTPLAVHDVFGGLAAAAAQLPRIRAARRRVAEIGARPDPVRRPDHPAPPPRPPYHLEVEGLAARWREDGPDVFRDLTFAVPAGARVAVTGPSGSGKSTLAAVLMRFVDPAAGVVRLGGTDITTLDGDDVRRVVGLCAQDAYVFDSTIAENVRLARPDASDDEVREALGRASLGTWVDGLPDGMRTFVGEHGARLSGGQRQRLALARVLLVGCPVLVLDEPTEHLDQETADALTVDLLGAAAGRTVLLITHRPVPAGLVDAVVRMPGATPRTPPGRGRNAAPRVALSGGSRGRLPDGA